MTAASTYADHPIHVLLVDDEPGLAELAGIHLARARGDFVTAVETSVSGAIDRLETETIDCIVSDYDMPGQNGLEFLQEVRVRDSTIPFVLFTGKGSEEIASKAISAGVSDYLQKQYGTDQYTLLANRIQVLVDRNRAEIAAEHSTHRWEQLVSTAPAPVVILDYEGTFRYANEAAATFAGADSSAALLSRSILEFVTEEVEPVVTERIRRTAADGPLPSIEMEFRGLDGRPRIAIVTSAPITFEGHAAIQSILLDVTEIQTLDRTLTHERSFTDAALDAIDGLFFVVDETGRSVRWNARVSEVTGYTDAQVERMAWQDFIEDADLHDLQQAFDEALERGASVSTGRVLTSDGESIPYEFRCSRLHTGEGTQLGVAGIGIDLRPRLALERELATQRKRYQAVFDRAFDGLAIADDDARYVEVNDSLCELFGRERDEMLGHTIAEFVAPDYDFGAEWGEFETAGELFGVVPVALPDGRTRTLEFAAVHEIFPGGHLSVLRDVTERESQAAAIERQNERLSEFASIVSHDLRNPLGIAMGYVNMASETKDVGVLERAQEALDRMDVLIEDVLTMAREGEIVEDVGPVSLTTAAETVWRTMRTDGAVLRIEGETTLRADESRLKQILMNLLSNAVAYAGETPTIRVGALSDRSGFYVEDDGPGIPEEKRDVVFERGHTSGPGLGYGLAIVDDLVTAHGWEITVTTGREGGARFEIASPTSATYPKLQSASRRQE